METEHDTWSMIVVFCEIISSPSKLIGKHSIKTWTQMETQLETPPFSFEAWTQHGILQQNFLKNDEKVIILKVDSARNHYGNWTWHLINDCGILWEMIL